MRPIVLVGVLLIASGVLALAYQSVSYEKTEQVVDLGPLEVSTETTETIPLPPVLGSAVVAAGVVVLLVGMRRS